MYLNAANNINLTKVGQETLNEIHIYVDTCMYTHM